MVKKEENAVIKKEETKAMAYVSNLFVELQKEFLEANAGLDLDFVYMTAWLSIDGKGNFVEKNGDTIVKQYKDVIDVVIAKGEQKFSLWGKEKSPEDGELIVAEDTREAAEEMFMQWAENNPEAAKRYDVNDIQSRYIAYVVPVETLKDDPKIYTMGFAPTSKMSYGQWAFKVFKGAFADKGIPKNTGINKIVTRIMTESRTNSQKQSYTSLSFEAVEMFNPEKHLN